MSIPYKRETRLTEKEMPLKQLFPLHNSLQSHEQFRAVLHVLLLRPRVCSTKITQLWSCRSSFHARHAELRSLRTPVLPQLSALFLNLGGAAR
jgi:hypothetical protein